MIQPIIRKVMAVFAITCLTIVSQAQTISTASSAKETTKYSKPYRILTAGKQVTVKSIKDIKSVMVWTSGGDRILEQKDINASSYNFRISVSEKIFFIMVRLADGKTYSEKIGVQ